MRGIEQASGQVGDFELVIQPDDILQILVQSQNVEAAEPFNTQVDEGGVGNQNFLFRGLLVDKEGYLIMPVLGKVKAAGLTRTAFVESLTNQIKPYVTDAVITVRILNFKVSVLGEVRQPGQVTVSSDRLTILEAITQAGDLTVQGTRENVLLIREHQGQKTFARINLTDGNLVNSPYYYLKQNDVIYVEPKPAAYNVSGIGPYLATTATVVSLLVTALVLIRL